MLKRRFFSLCIVVVRHLNAINANRYDALWGARTIQVQRIRISLMLCARASADNPFAHALGQGDDNVTINNLDPHRM